MLAMVMGHSLAAVPLSAPSEPPHQSRDAFHRKDTITIGMLVPDKNQTASMEAARMAVEEANHRGGTNGSTLKLVIRDTEGPWGAGSKESVSLVYEDSASVIVGALDGRNGHLAEQVAAKSHLAYMETRATESTLSQAFVPYFMRCIPNDDQQARAILELSDQNGSGKLAVVSDDRYDNHNAARSFTRIAALENRAVPLILPVDPSETETDRLLKQLRSSEIKHLVLPFRSGFTVKLLESVRITLPGVIIYGTLGFIADMVPGDPAWQDLEGMVFVSPGFLYTRDGATFEKKYVDRTGFPPPISSAYTYDGVHMVIEAILRAGPDREAIKETLASMKGFQGTTGPIEFDGKGNRTGPVRFMRVEKGIPVLLPGSSKF
jgi:branched-chain amino acid transport system substrate-binding protein